MELLLFLGGLVVIAGIYVGLNELNQYCEDEYGYKPLNKNVLLFEVIPSCCVAAGYLLLGHSADTDNALVLLAIALLLQIGLAWYLTTKTNWVIGISLSIFLFFVALLMAIIIVLIVYVALAGKGKKKRRAR